MKISDLPREIVSIIMTYDGSIKERNGIFMNQIPKTDSRYNVLQSIPLPRQLKYGSDFDIVINFSRENLLLYIGSGYVYYDNDIEEREQIRYCFGRIKSSDITPMYATVSVFRCDTDIGITPPILSVCWFRK